MNVSEVCTARIAKSWSKRRPLSVDQLCGLELVLTLSVANVIRAKCFDKPQTKLYHLLALGDMRRKEFLNDLDLE